MSYPTNNIGMFGAIVADVSMEEQQVLSLDQLLIQAYASTKIGAEEEQAAVLRKLSDSKTTSDPEELFKIQQRTADYNLQVSMISTLTRKGVSTVETLLRS